MQDLKVTLVQANQAWEDKQANFENYESLLENVSTDLIVLPEMFQTGFSMNVHALAEEWENSASIRWLQKQASKKNCAFYTSLIISENHLFYNRGVFVFPDGKIIHYDKRKVFSLAGEDLYFTPGQKEVIINYKGWNIQLQICYDLRFPEIVRNRIEKGRPAYDLILYVANWPEKRISHWDTLLNARAIENQSYVVGVNRSGVDANKTIYNGNSKVVNALGEKVFLTHEDNFVETITLIYKNLINAREKLPFLRDV